MANVKKTELKLCICSGKSKCIFSCKSETKPMEVVTKLEGIDQISVDGEKMTVIGEVDPVLLVKKLRKAKRYAEIISVGPPKEEKPKAKPDVPENSETTYPIKPPSLCGAVTIDYYEPYYDGGSGCGLCIIL